jgi:predicted pyridoxine 5'-phosphate oxidase superfamily flavin-nucleotide-binding protein
MTRFTEHKSRGQDASPFHEGELAVQEATGERAAAARIARMLSTTVPLAPARFLAEQRMLVLASVDGAGAVWASVIFGEEGFATAPTPEQIAIDRRRAEIDPRDALLAHLRVSSMLGVLAIELSSRRRYRINGTVTLATEERIVVDVREAYVNCPKYIQRRKFRERGERAPDATTPAACGIALDPERTARIRRADTMFVASRHPTRGADASHRGGEPGFLDVRDDRTIRVPEYAGNGLYNTLGNLVVASEAGLAIVDFEDGRVIQLTGSAKVVLDAAIGESRSASTSGAETGRYWDFVVSRWTEFALPERFQWELVDRSPFNPRPHP